jgi:Zn-dependent alcohol dehydrogenase
MNEGTEGTGKTVNWAEMEMVGTVSGGGSSGCGSVTETESKTLRDEFAMAAITGAVGDANWSTIDQLLAAQAAARVAYAIADAMMEARKL